MRCIPRNAYRHTKTLPALRRAQCFRCGFYSAAPPEQLKQCHCALFAIGHLVDPFKTRERASAYNHPLPA